ncbi:response regulator transcription factor (plasmid) [Alkalihalophilus pseudofirmus]|uniref:response regulator transcription factor n=1 Tax=Alkalihalophilus pseudofirmus TaxID=79885 RepID=UPI00259BE36A|nr:response regulator transcription factor [Alkalihalophilus pseudofirmus]WEG19174.1 response regulator transcription factor [Alkalihalophilus pseudofirmus]
MAQILIVDDDKHIRNLISKYLGGEGYSVKQAGNGIEALEELEKNDYSLVVVDIMMPEMDGYELTKKIRKHYQLPILMLTAKSQIQDKETGFSLGTDDYLVKPFELKELLFRIKALLRRYHQVAEMTIKIHSVVINKAAYEVNINGSTILLPLKEFELLYYLASNANRVLSREQLIQHVWGSQYDGSDRTVDVHIKRLRERFTKITDDFSIKTIRGVGYVLEVKK